MAETGSPDPEVRPIPTKYKEVEFRSRSEARWAIFFDELGIAWQYEPDAYDTKAGRYLPDFWLPDQRYFWEVKPHEPTPSESAAMRALVEATEQEGFIAWEIVPSDRTRSAFGYKGIPYVTANAWIDRIVENLDWPDLYKKRFHEFDRSLGEHVSIWGMQWTRCSACNRLAVRFLGWEECPVCGEPNLEMKWDGKDEVHRAGLKAAAHKFWNP